MSVGKTSLRHFPSLDGLRALSILLVLLGHIEGTRHVGALPALHVFGDLAHLGVTVFFVISGFLITSLLLREHEQTGKVSLRLFYARRALRIFPASFAYIGVMALASLLGRISIPRGDFLFAVTYTTNYLLHPSWYLGHLWSLSVEEQFYLLWPCTFVLLRRRQAIWGAAAFFLLGPVARGVDWFFLRHTAYYTLPMFPVVADSLAAGCLLAIGRDWLEQQRWYRALLRPSSAGLMLATVLVVNGYMGYNGVFIAGTALINLLIAVLIHRCVFCSRDLAARVLNWKPMAALGVLSYSLYLWQQPFLNRNSASWLAAFPQNLVFACAAAIASYTLLEKPLMQLRSRLRQKPLEQPPAEMQVAA